MSFDISQIAKYINDFEAEAKVIAEEASLEALRLRWLGKEGVVKSLFAQLKQVPVELKAETAARLNKLRDRAESFVAEKSASFQAKAITEKLSSEFLDLSLPSRTAGVGHAHPLRLVERRITEILKRFGFELVEGPEVETEYYCFDALNIPKHHPARDMQDTFYTSTNELLRTHTTSILSRELEKKKLPLKNIYCGRVYRNEKEDASHQAMFHQYDLVWIEEGVGLNHLMALMRQVIWGIYGKQRKVRFVPKFYPYTEPSFGPQIDCSFCLAKGCQFCKGAGWVTVAGAGVVHENVIKEFGLDPKKVGGVAFGFGTSRMAAQFYGAPNLKILYDADLRYLGEL